MAPITKKSKPEPESQEVADQPPSYEDSAGPLPITLPFLDLHRTAGPGESTTVTSDECIAHLKFLGALADLRELISQKDGLFGLYDDQVNRVPPERANEASARIREKRWAVYVARAVDRFTIWWEAAIPRCGTPPTVTQVRRESRNPREMGILPIMWETEQLPPLDVLMVWHAYILNPRDYLEDCFRQARMSCWITGFPWTVINPCIDDRDLAYVVPEEGRNFFAATTGLNWDNLHDPETKTLVCPRYKCPVPVPWTNGAINADCNFEESDGYADKSFHATCPRPFCQCTIDHEKLKLRKFRADLVELVELNRPMPGTVLNLNGALKSQTRMPELYPNALMLALQFHLMDMLKAGSIHLTKMVHLRDWIEQQIKQRWVLLEANHQSRAVDGIYRDKNSRIAIRKMMSRYWSNSSPFALDLVGAVIRQGTFVQKMDDLDWLHSPTVSQTMDRLIKKYQVFFKIMASHPGKMAVPTLDVDLAWHTHQLSPARYYDYSVSKTKDIFIDHDDKVEETKLSDGFEWTTKEYRRLTGGDIYSQCLCWYCEAVRAPSLLERFSSHDTRARENLHDREGVSSDPNRNPHISAHNAVRVEGFSKNDSHIQLKMQRLRASYERACRRADKQDKKKQSKDGKGKAVDEKNGKDNRRSTIIDPYPVPLIWGYPIAVPYAAPYMCDPGVNSASYANNPACMNVTPGAMGNCVGGGA
ncbi:hypothetical protein MW887_002167 [Aspergillus wentii]|nr:hypothetical protein MW887_002167 [Aspergillus wentii]